MVIKKEIKYADDNTIYVCGDEFEQIWKLSMRLLEKSFQGPMIHSTDQYSIDEHGFIFILFESGVEYQRDFIIEALKFYNVEFNFDYSTLQNEYDLLEEDEYIYPLRNYDGTDISLEDYGIFHDSEEPRDLTIHLINLWNNTDPDNYIHDVVDEIDEIDETNQKGVDEFISIIKKEKKEEQLEQKKLESKYKRRRTKYENLGCKILNGYDALKAIKESFTHSMVAINTDEIYSIEYSGSAYYCSDLDDDADYYTLRKIVNGKIEKEVLWFFLLPNIFDYEWAIKEYHTGIYSDQPDY